MKFRHLLTVLAGAAFAALPLSAQTFVGSDNFDNGELTSNWDYQYRFSGAAGNGLLDFNNNRLDFLKTTGVGSHVRLWDSDNTASPNVVSTSFATSWSMTFSVTNTLSGLAVGEFATVGLQVENDNANYSALMLSATNTGSGTQNFIRAEGSGFTAVNTSLGDNTDIFLRLTWDAGAQTLGASYSLDGTSFNPVATFLPVTQWDNSGGGNVANGFNFGVFGNSNMAAAISGGSVYGDNFSVSAIPEPSTYATLAGVGALGLAFWRRRQAPRPTA